MKVIAGTGTETHRYGYIARCGGRTYRAARSLRWTSRRAGSAGGAGPRGGDVQGRRGDVRALGLTGGALAALAHGTGKYAPTGQEVCGGPRRGRAMGS